MNCKTFATFNTAGLATARKRLLLDEWCFVSSISICAIQESNLQESQYKLKYGSIFGTPSSSSHAGLAFWCSNTTIISEKHIVDVVPDVVQELTFWMDDTFYIVFNLHLPHRDKQAEEAVSAWIQRLKHWGIKVQNGNGRTISDKKDYNLVDFDRDFQQQEDERRRHDIDLSVQPVFLVLGDFNLEMERLDDKGSQRKKLAVRERVQSVLSALSLRFLDFSLTDQHLHGTRGSAILDYICVPKAWFLRVHSMEVIPHAESDHAMVVAKILIQINKQKPPYWRFKNQLLGIPSFMKSMRSLLDEWIQQVPAGPEDFMTWWDNFKKNFMLVSRDCWNKLLARGEVSSLYDGVHKESFTKRPRGLPPQIHFLKEEGGGVTSSKEIIMEKLAVFFSDLYRSPDGIQSPPSTMTFGLPKIEQSLKADLERPVTLEDLYMAASGMNLEKAPGGDGLTLEVYLAFWQQLGPLVLIWFEHVVRMGTLSGSAAVGILTLINKPGDPRLIQNWRPISLLTVELKIVARAIATKLARAVTSVIPKCQTGLPGSSIFDSLAVVRDIIALGKSSKEPLYMLSLDMAKAFDRVNHVFLFHLLKIIDLPASMVCSVRALYTGFTCRVKNVSCMSRSFPYGRGIRQGDPTSTLLFTLAMQPLLNAWHLALYEEGFRLSSGERILLTAYADDVTLFLSSSSSIKTILETFDQVAKYSEALLNVNKSTLFMIKEAQQNLEDGSLGSIFPLSNDYVKILGIVFTRSLRISDDQWNCKWTSSWNTLSLNAKRLEKMTFLHRAQWVKRCIWPRWAFLLKVLQPTQKQLDQLSSLMVEAIWLGGRHWLSATDLAADVSLGGLDALLPNDKIDVLRIAMIVRLYATDLSGPQFELSKMILDKYGGMGAGFDILHTKPEESQLASLPAVYAAAFRAWERLPVCICPQAKEDILNLPAFNSKFLLQLDEPVEISCELAKAMRVRTVKDLYYYVPSVTRYSQELVKRVKLAVDSWELPPWPNGAEQEGMKNKEQFNSCRPLTFFLMLSEKVLEISSWTNKHVAGVLQSKLEGRSFYVPSKSWKILTTLQAPPPFINNMWKFMHKAVPTPTFYYHLEMLEVIQCVLCGSTDSSYDHQYRTCDSLSLAIHTLEFFIEKLQLAPLENQWQLYPDPVEEHRLANFLVVAFIYAASTATRSLVNSSNLQARSFNSFFLSVITRHLIYFAMTFPPSEVSLRYKWKTYVYKELVAFFKKDSLFILDQGSFKKYDEHSKTLL